MWLRKEKKKLKSLIGFLSANKIDNYNKGDKREKKKKIQKTLQNSQKIRIINVLLESPLSHLTSLGYPPTLLISGPAVGAAPILTWSHSCVFLPAMSIAIRVSAFSFVGALNVPLCIPLAQSLPS